MTAEILNWVLILSGIIFTGFIKVILGRLTEVTNKLEKLRDDHYELKSNMPINYVGKMDFQYVLDNLFSQLSRIEDKIDNKLDKKS